MIPCGAYPFALLSRGFTLLTLFTLWCGWNCWNVVDEAEGADRADETDVTDMAEIALHINALFYLDCLGYKELKKYSI